MSKAQTDVIVRLRIENEELRSALTDVRIMSKAQTEVIAALRIANEKLREALREAQKGCRGVLAGDGEGINARAEALLLQIQATLSEVKP